MLSWQKSANGEYQKNTSLINLLQQHKRPQVLLLLLICHLKATPMEKLE